jgi:hypothetical protein
MPQGNAAGFRVIRLENLSFQTPNECQVARLRQEISFCSSYKSYGHVVIDFNWQLQVSQIISPHFPPFAGKGADKSLSTASVRALVQELLASTSHANLAMLRPLDFGAVLS